MEQWKGAEGHLQPHMTFDEVSMERSKSFVMALQELKNLKPQLYSAAEYCEKSYLNNEQKQVVLDNLKDYAVRALVNAVDHLGTVAYKLTDIVEKQKSDISTVELKVSCLSQQVATCHTYVDKECLWQQKLPVINRRHHKHYVLPNAVNKKVRINPQPQIYSDEGRNQVLAKPAQSKGPPASKTLSWHLASESKSGSDETPESQPCFQDSKASTSVPEAANLCDAVEATPTMPLAAHLQSTAYKDRSHTALRGPGSKVEPLELPKTISTFSTPVRQEITRPTTRSKGVFAALFAKNKLAKQKRTLVL